MSSRRAKQIIFLVLLTLPTILMQNAAAQSINFEPALTAEPQTGTKNFSDRFGDAKMPTADFRSVEFHKRYDSARNLPTAQSVERISSRPMRQRGDSAADDGAVDESFRWLSATKQTLMFLAIQHGYAFTQPKTREALKGKFWKDYVKSVKSLHGWADGGRFFTNYIAHPMEGAFLGYLQIQNDPKGLKQQFGASPDYWRSRMKAMAWSAAWSTQFEIGPISQASIGNVGRLHDNGAGFDTNKINDGHGLVSMKQRAAGLGGTLEIISDKNSGTTTTLIAPLAAETEEKN